MKTNSEGIDKKALLGAAYEELGAQEITVQDFENFYLGNEKMTAEPIDINKDGKISVSEYATTILAADMLSKENPQIANIDGSINSKGFNAVLAYTNKANAAAATKLYSNLYNTYKLGTNDK